MQQSMARFHNTYSVNLGFRKVIATQDPGLIDHVLRTNHRNYNKSAIVTEQLGRFIGNGLLTSNGEYWLRQRRLIQPGFHHEKIQALYAIIQRTVDEFLDEFPTGKIIDVYPLMNKIAFNIVINTLFNVRIQPETRGELSRFITETQDFVTKDVRQPYKSWWFRLTGEVDLNLKNAQRSRNIIREIIRTRRESHGTFHDLLNMLLEARYEDTGEPMKEDQVIDEILILLIAGHETTANALSWTLYLLATHPQELEALRAATTGLTTATCTRSETLLSVINEGMRLYPPAWISDRVAINDDHYRDFRIPKDSILLLFYYGLHRDPQYWNDPSAFKPQRFSQQAQEKDKPKVFYPFGGGPRLCIGNNFALAEMAIFLQTFIHRFHVLPGDAEPSIHPLITLRPDRVMLKIEARN
jgi:cytochrome P450